MRRLPVLKIHIGVLLAHPLVSDDNFVRAPGIRICLLGLLEPDPEALRVSRILQAPFTGPVNVAVRLIPLASPEREAAADAEILGMGCDERAAALSASSYADI